MKQESMKALMAALAPVIHDHVEKVTQPLRNRITELEAKPEMKYHGIWSEKTSYPVGSFVTDGGSVWFCSKRSTERPGTSDSWQLACKRGRDGRDGKDAAR
jgi:hypothetical protein